MPSDQQPLFHIVDLNYISLYISDFHQAIDFYTRVFGEPASIDQNKTTYGWKMGATWLTIFDGKKAGLQAGNPSNTEFAIQVSAPMRWITCIRHCSKQGQNPACPLKILPCISQCALAVWTILSACESTCIIR